MFVCTSVCVSGCVFHRVGMLLLSLCPCHDKLLYSMPQSADRDCR